MVGRLSNELRDVGKSASSNGELWTKASAEAGRVKLPRKSSKLYDN